MQFYNWSDPRVLCHYSCFRLFEIASAKSYNDISNNLLFGQSAQSSSFVGLISGTHVSKLYLSIYI